MPCPTWPLPLLLLACSAPAATAPPNVTLAHDCLQHPVGPPTGRGYYVAQGFGENHHLGEDWNGTGGGNTDLGDPVYAVTAGRITAAEDFGGGWGRVVRVEHHLEGPVGPVHFESLYAHLSALRVATGDNVERGQVLGAIGTAHGQYLAHLHLEIRDTVGLPLGPGYSADATGYVDPRAFLAVHRCR